MESIKKKGVITINYYQNGLLQTCKGRVSKLNLHDQTLSLEDEQHNIFSIRLSGITEIH
ncbi:YolD-like family protein [Bacillus megaterium]|nr:YolD-like family protein [Priestia megaterium]